MKSVFLFIFLIVSFSTFAQRDSIVLGNGDRIIGELKSMDKGILTIEPYYSDSDFKIEWDKVKYINTESKYIIYLSRKKGYIRSHAKREEERFNSVVVSDTARPGRVLLNGVSGPVSIAMNEIVFLNSYKESFISRLSVNIDVGLTVTEANNLRQFHADGVMSYQSEKWRADAGSNIINSQQDSVAKIHRMESYVSFNRYLPFDFYIPISANFMENDEMNIDLRTTIKTGLGYFFFRTNKYYWKLESGIAYSLENFLITDPPIVPNPRKSGELYMGSEVNIFDVGDMDLLVYFIVFPNVSDWGRYRTDFKLDLKYDLPYDFYVKIGTKINYDNRPVGDAGEFDYVIQTGFGWEL